MIGDPSFKAEERSLNSAEKVAGWVNALINQIEQLLAPHLSEPVTIVNNADWMSNINVIDFFRDIGKHFSINTMISRESVRQRLKRPEQGITFTEFSYNLLQSYDFSVLNREYDCSLQIGGNDQWGNIVSGIDLTRRQNRKQVFGLTLPLITKSDGTKFGKTESGTIWLDPEKTSPYMFYQFWLSTSDADVFNLLRYYTLLPCDEIDKLEWEDKKAQGKPQSQKILAQHITRFVHGEAGLQSAERITEALFTGGVEKLSYSEIKQLELDGMRTIETPQLNLVELLIESGFAKSRRIARELIEDKAISVNGEKVISGNARLGFPLFDEYWLLQRGKKYFCLIKRK